VSDPQDKSGGRAHLREQQAKVKQQVRQKDVTGGRGVATGATLADMARIGIAQQQLHTRSQDTAAAVRTQLLAGKREDFKVLGQMVSDLKGDDDPGMKIERQKAVAEMMEVRRGIQELETLILESIDNKFEPNQAVTELFTRTNMSTPCKREVVDLSEDDGDTRAAKKQALEKTSFNYKSEAVLPPSPMRKDGD
jgi:hypothetical protein